MAPPPARRRRKPRSAFDQACREAYGDIPAVPYLREINDAIYLIALAAEKAGSNDSTAMRDALREVANEPGTVVGPGPEGLGRPRSRASALVRTSTTRGPPVRSTSTKMAMSSGEHPRLAGQGEAIETSTAATSTHHRGRSSRDAGAPDGLRRESPAGTGVTVRSSRSVMTTDRLRLWRSYWRTEVTALVMEMTTVAIEQQPDATCATPPAMSSSRCAPSRRRSAATGQSTTARSPLAEERSPA